MKDKRWILTVVVASFFLGGCLHLQAGEAEEVGLFFEPQVENKVSRKDKLFDPDDGCLDISLFLDEPLGFVPVVVPITEPSVGVGAALSLVFIDTNEGKSDENWVKPSITAVGGWGTENGTKGYFGMYSGHWLDGRLDTSVVVADFTANLDFYGSRGQGLRYSLDSQMVRFKVGYRLGESRSMLGVGYTYAKMASQFKTVNLPPEMALAKRESTIGGLSLIYGYDSRDNVFTPNSGFRGDVMATFFDPSLGASAVYQRVEVDTFYFHPVTQTLVFGVRGTVQSSFGDVPFYQLPFVQLRGVPVMRYQGEHVAFAEAELRWKVMNRVSLVGFAGAGLTSSRDHDISWHRSVFAGGVGIRYEIARKQGLHMGFDLAFSDEDAAFYVVFGGAWLRP